MASPTVPTLPPAPVPDNPEATFDALAGAFVPALNPWGVAVQAVGDYVETTAAEVEANATVASAAAGLANYQGDWLVGTTYTTGQSVRDDGRYWFALAGSTGVTPVEGATWTEIIRIPTPVEDGKPLVGSGAGLAYGENARTPQPGEWLTETRYLASDTFTVPDTVTLLRVYAVGKGGNGTIVGTAASGSGGGMAFGTIAVTPGEELDLDITAGVATVSRGMTALFTANGAANSTSGSVGAAGTASIDASVMDGAAYTGGSGVVASAGGASAASPLGAGVDAIAGGGGSGIGGNCGGGQAGGGVGGAANGVYAGGAGTAATASLPGQGRGRLALFTDPLLRKCVSAASGNNAGVSGGEGAGGNNSAHGGFGAGGGALGNGGELGGGGASANVAGLGSGGIGGGGGGGSATAGASLGGPAAIWLFY